MNRRLLHYSKTPLGPLRSFTPQDQERNEGRLFKPIGLWVSAEGEYDWAAWCQAEQFCIERLAYATEIVIQPAANILRLCGAADIDAFHDMYAIKDGPQWYNRKKIPWARVAADYDGIIIAPYVWSRRLEGEASGWYYGWDCASGCIWNANAMYAVASTKISETV